MRYLLCNKEMEHLLSNEYYRQILDAVVRNVKALLLSRNIQRFCNYEDRYYR